ncbi:Transposase, L1 containing protein [Cricetulus griseus]|nr:Transposase, L1 containing protein [Cricetulus griseus]
MRKRRAIRVLDLHIPTGREPWSSTRQRKRLLLLEEGMRRRQYKNTFNSRKTNMTAPESRDSAPARPEHPKADKAEENDLKHYFMKMIESLKEHRRKSLKETEGEKTNQKIKEINKSLKEKTVQTAQDLKTEIETIKKAQSKGMLEIETLGKQSGATDICKTNRIQEMEERISGVEDTLAEIDSLTKENLKFNKSLTQNIQEIWDTVKRPNLRIIGIEEGEREHLVPCCSGVALAKGF